MNKNPIPYPCTQCTRTHKRKYCEHSKCKAYREWLKMEWYIACLPFRQLKQEIEKQRGNK